MLITSSNVSPDRLVKARRRIKQFIASGGPVPRVRQIDDKTFHYLEKPNHQTVLVFKLDKIGRLRMKKT